MIQSNKIKEEVVFTIRHQKLSVLVEETMISWFGWLRSSLYPTKTLNLKVFKVEALISLQLVLVVLVRAEESKRLSCCGKLPSDHC